MDLSTLIKLALAAVFSGLLAFVLTPAIRALAIRIGATDVPQDSRRMHKKPVPRLGSLAVFLGFLLTSLFFTESSPTLIALLLGGAIIVAMGILDDVFGLHPIVKFLIQIAAAAVALAQGLEIPFIRVGDYYVIFGYGTIPLTILWIVGMTSAMSLLDDLDGLSGGIGAIAAASLGIVLLFKGNIPLALLTWALFGSLIGFLPFHRHPARIFLGSSGAQLLGFILSVLSLSGLCKTHALISLLAPILLLALPLFAPGDLFRRPFKGKNPFRGDRGHIHHHLLDLGHSQKETVSILLGLSALFGICAVTVTLETSLSPWISVAILGGTVLLYLFFLHPKKDGMEDFMPEPEQVRIVREEIEQPDEQAYTEGEALEKEQDTSSFRYMMSEEQDVVPSAPETQESPAPQRETEEIERPAPILFDLTEDEDLSPAQSGDTVTVPAVKVEIIEALEETEEMEEIEEIEAVEESLEPPLPEPETPLEDSAPTLVLPKVKTEPESVEEASKPEEMPEETPQPPPAVPHRMEQDDRPVAQDGYLSVDPDATAPRRRHPRPSRKPKGME